MFEVDDVSDQYDVSPDGTKFLMLRRDAAGAGTAPGQVNVVLNLFEELKRLVPTKLSRCRFGPDRRISPRTSARVDLSARTTGVGFVGTSLRY